MTPLEDPITLGEVSRNVSSLRIEIKEAIQSINLRLDRSSDQSVSSAIYAADKSNVDYRLQDLAKELSEMKSENAKKEERNTSLRRLIIFSLAIPSLFMVINMLFTYYLFLRGGATP